MKVTSLEIGRHSTYHEKVGQLFGKVDIEGAEGKQEIQLSFRAINQIFTVVAREVSEQAEINARMTRRALQDAIEEPLTLESDGTLQITKSDDIPF